MIKSMTSFGRARDTVAGKDITVEIKSVNSRYFDCNVKISRMYGFLEEKIKSYMQTNGLSRGKVEVYVGVDVIDSVGGEVLYDSAYAASYLAALCRLRDEFGLKDDISVMRLAQNRDIFMVKKPEDDLESDWRDIREVFDRALDAFVSGRESEGANLEADIRAKMDGIKKIVDEIEILSVADIAEYKGKLEARLRQILGDNKIDLDEQRILTECAIFADKIAIDEELVRLRSHFKTFEEILASTDPVGRKLDFLLQELNRETNTIGSKCNSAAIARHIVNVKSELEKIREQIQNIE